MPKLTHLTIFNSKAGSYTRREAQEIKQILNQHPEKLDGIIFNSPDLSKLEQFLMEHKDYHPEILGVGGGDGTISRTLTAVKEVWGYLPEYLAFYALGTVNNASANFGLADITDKLWRKLHRKTSPLGLADYIHDCIYSSQEINTEEVPLLDVNGQKGLNLGFGAVPKLIWTYYGQTMKRYYQLEEELDRASPNNYPWLIEKVWKEKAEDPSFIEVFPFGNGDLFKKSGAASGVYTGVVSALAAVFPFLERGKFYAETFPGKIYLDGKEFLNSKKVNAIYVSAYEKFNLGFRQLSFAATPEAKTRKGKVQVVLSTASLFNIVNQIPTLMEGEHLKGCHYQHAQEMRLEADEPIICQLDAEIMAFDKEVTVKYDQLLRVIVPR